MLSDQALRIIVASDKYACTRAVWRRVQEIRLAEQAAIAQAEERMADGIDPDD